MQNSKVDLCRTCLRETGNINPLTHTFSGYEDINFSVMLMSCTSICIKPDDTLPLFICENCMTTLIMAYNFKEQCERSDLFLRTHECLKSFEFNIQTIHDRNIKNIENIIHVIHTENHHLVNNDIITESIGNTNKTLDTNKNSWQSNKDKVTATCLNSRKFFIVHRKNREVNNEHKQKSITDSEPNLLEVHERKKKLKTYKCPECDKQFTTRYGLKYHSKHHTGIRKYVCPIESCKKKFLWEPSLKRHMELHSTEKKHLCYVCGKSYNASDSLRYHIRNHKGERPHLCVHCGKTFKQAIHLKYHVRSHNGERPHVCLKCNKSYTRPSQLKKHLNKYCGVGRIPPQGIRTI